MLIHAGEGASAYRRLAAEEDAFRRRLEDALASPVDSSAPSRATAPGDRRKLRGVPCIGRGIQGGRRQRAAPGRLTELVRLRGSAWSRTRAIPGANATTSGEYALTRGCIRATTSAPGAANRLTRRTRTSWSPSSRGRYPAATFPKSGSSSMAESSTATKAMCRVRGCIESCATAGTPGTPLSTVDKIVSLTGFHPSRAR